MAIDFRSLRQAEASECGLVCVAIVSALLGAELSLPELRRRHPVSPRGLTLKEVADIAGALNLEGRAVRCELDELRELQCPAILHWGTNHFVVLERVGRKGCQIIDPARGGRLVSLNEVNRKFTGIALELAATPAFRKRREPSPLNMLSLISWVPSLRSGLIQILLLSVLLQAYMIVSPLYLQLAIDQGALRGDSGLVASLAVGFGIFAIFNAMASGLRGIALQKLSAILSWDMTRRLFHHMVRLPLPWFQRRRLADALTRFDSIQPIQNLIASGLVGVLIDGILSVTMLILMLILAPPLALIAIVALVMFAALKLLTLSLSMKLGAASLSASIAEQGKRIETLRAMQTIKVMAAESQREGDWANKLANTVHARQKSGTLTVVIGAVQQLIDALAIVAIVFLGVRAILRTEITVGLLYAFIAYRAQFAGATQALFDQFISWRMLNIYTQRIADIVLTPTERGLERSVIGMPTMHGAIRLRNVSFGYAPHEQPVLTRISIAIEPGEFVAITGPSGAGKSTLLKVLMGLYPATSGDVLIDGQPLGAWGASAIRRTFGVVMQDDELLSGTVAENVAFFDEQIDMERVWAALSLASIDQEVLAMPMRADTLIGDMGSAFSGGQKQRILLARAFYRRPKVLLLDEATSHVDVPRERAINNALRALSMTRIVIAHRPETIAAADRIIVISGGNIVSEKRRSPNSSDTNIVAN